jgi:hypothetical protein
MARSILETLGTLPNGEVKRLDSDGLRRAIERWHPKGKKEEPRRMEMRRRLDLYRDRGRTHFEKAIDALFKNKKVREWRKAFLEYAEFQNVTNRVIRETSTVYSEPATREIKGVKATEQYLEFQQEVSYNHKLRLVNRLGNLCNEMLVWPIVRDDSVPVLRTVAPDRFTVIPHPNDPLRPAMFVVDQFPDGLSVSSSDPHYLGMSEREWIVLDKDWRVLKIEEHGLEQMPALLWHREEPDEVLLDAHTGKDLISAHLAVALLNTLMLKHQKAGTKLAYATGDTSDVARGQAMDEESLIELGEGVSLNTLDLGADPKSYIDATRAVIKQIAANRGIPESVFDLSYQATSGFEIELKRTGLREIRRDQVMVFRPFEKRLASLWSAVLTSAGSEWAYTMDGWSIDFGEIDTPQEPMAKLDYWRKLEELGLANRVEMYLEQNPEATEKEALAAVTGNMEMRLQWQRMFQSEGAGMFAPRQPGGQPLNGQRRTPEPEEGDEDEAKEMVQ